jgi:hypothetical protein
MDRNLWQPSSAVRQRVRILLVLAAAVGSEKTSVVDRRHPAREVAAADTSGLTVFDEGEGIDVHSLTLHRSRLSWLDAGATRSVFLR